MEKKKLSNFALQNIIWGAICILAIFLAATIVWKFKPADVTEVERVVAPSVNTLDRTELEKRGFADISEVAPGSYWASIPNTTCRMTVVVRRGTDAAVTATIRSSKGGSGDISLPDASAASARAIIAESASRGCLDEKPAGNNSHMAAGSTPSPKK